MQTISRGVGIHIHVRFVACYWAKRGRGGQATITCEGGKKKTNQGATASPLFLGIYVPLGYMSCHTDS
jgi:hypothetical protein